MSDAEYEFHLKVLANEKDDALVDFVLIGLEEGWMEYVPDKNAPTVPFK